MAKELYFTSAERGLQTGSFGYCTVAKTAGISRTLQGKLEELSTYRPLYPVHDPQASLNPIAISHTRLSADGQSYSVLSRIAAAPPDYSGRSNYLAHHVVLEMSERSPAGPAWTAMQPAALSAKWDGVVREIPSGRAVPRGEVEPSVCRAWQQISGDAGWAGVLAEHLANKPSQPFYLIFDPGMDLIALIAEAIALLPAERRWDVTFSTYFTGARGSAACTVRGVARGSEEAAAARAAPHLDLRSLRGQAAPSNPYVDAARTGRAPVTPAAGGLGSGWVNPLNQSNDLLGSPQGLAGLPSIQPGRAFDFAAGDLPPAPPNRGGKWFWILFGTGLAAGMLVLGIIVGAATSRALLLKRPTGAFSDPEARHEPQDLINDTKTLTGPPAPASPQPDPARKAHAAEQQPDSAHAPALPLEIRNHGSGRQSDSNKQSIEQASQMQIAGLQNGLEAEKAAHAATISKFRQFSDPSKLWVEATFVKKTIVIPLIGTFIVNEIVNANSAETVISGSSIKLDFKSVALELVPKKHTKDTGHTICSGTNSSAMNLEVEVSEKKKTKESMKVTVSFSVLMREKSKLVIKVSCFPIRSQENQLKLSEAIKYLADNYLLRISDRMNNSYALPIVN